MDNCGHLPLAVKNCNLWTTVDISTLAVTNCNLWTTVDISTLAVKNCNLWTTVDIYLHHEKLWTCGHLPLAVKNCGHVDNSKMSTVVHRLQFSAATPILFSYKTRISEFSISYIRVCIFVYPKSPFRISASVSGQRLLCDANHEVETLIHEKFVG